MFGGKDQETEKTYRVGKQVLRESELKIQVTYKGEVFTLLYPTPLRKSMIETEMARRFGGLPRSSFSQEHIALVEACVIIDTLMIPKECPSWFTTPWECVDENLITEIYQGYFQFRDRFRERLRSNGAEGGGKGDSP